MGSAVPYHCVTPVICTAGQPVVHVSTECSRGSRPWLAVAQLTGGYCRLKKAHCQRETPDVLSIEDGLHSLSHTGPAHLQAGLSRPQHACRAAV